MVNQETAQLADRLIRLELHAAHSGREVMRALVDNLSNSKESTPADMLYAELDNVRCLLRALPPYAPPLNSINRVLHLMETAIEHDLNVEQTKAQLAALRRGTGEPKSNWESITSHLIDKLPPDTVVYTHTLSETVLGVLIRLNQQGKIKHVNVTESRPNNDGWDTARRLAEQEVSVTLFLDAAMPAAIENSHLMLSGAEIINQDGSVVGKVGAYPAAQFCRLYHKPVYIVADTNKINHIQWHDFHLPPLTAKDLGIDEPQPGVQYGGAIFDITPSHLICGIATEVGLLTARDIPALTPAGHLSKWLANELGEGLQVKQVSA